MISQLLLILGLVGTWHYAGFQYEGQFYTNPNPRLHVEFTFDPDNTYTYRWYREDEPGFCELRGIYSLQGDTLWQRSTWLNPQNGVACGTDPDMKVDRESTTRITLTQSELWLNLELNGKEFIYMLRRKAQSAGSSSEGETKP